MKTYHFKHYFNLWGSVGNPRNDIPDETKIEIAKKRAAEDLAKQLLENAHFEIDKEGNVNGVLYIGD